MLKLFKPILTSTIILTAFIITGCKKEQDAAVVSQIKTVILVVNTSELPATGPVDLNLYCSFSGQTAGSNLIEFLTEVNKGDQIVWLGIPGDSSNQNDEVLITKVKHENQKQVLTKTQIIGKHGNVLGKVRNEDVQSGDIDKYSLHFKIKKEGGNPGRTYIIDPKLKVL